MRNYLFHMTISPRFTFLDLFRHIQGWVVCSKHVVMSYSYLMYIGSLVPETVEKYLLSILSDLVMSLAVGRIQVEF